MVGNQLSPAPKLILANWEKAISVYPIHCKEGQKKNRTISCYGKSAEAGFLSSQKEIQKRDGNR